MKNVPVFVLCIIFIMPVILSCAGAAEPPGSRVASQSGEITFNDVTDKEWLLTEIRRAGNTIQIDRRQLEADNIGGFFTISFQTTGVNGTAAPNRYFGPYTTGSNRALSIGNLASTMMFSFIELEELKEHEYFAYLSNVTRWNLPSGRLELYSRTGDGAEAVLVFTHM